MTLRHQILATAILPALAAACAPESPEAPPRLASDTLLELDDTRLFVHREGPAAAELPALVVVHGGPLLDQTYLRSPLAPLADARTLVFYDQRLSGRSDGAADSSSIRLATFAEDIESVRTALDLGRIDLLGHSWGGLIALAYAIEHPEAVRRLVLVSPIAPSARLWQEEQSAQAAAIESADTAGLGALRGDPGVAGAEPAAIEALLRHTFRSQLHDPALADSLDLFVPPDYLQRSRRFSAMGPDLASYDFTERLTDMAAPTLLIYGDDEVGPAIGGEALARGIPEATSIVLDDTGHFAFLESPERFLAEVRAFLGG